LNNISNSIKLNDYNIFFPKFIDKRDFKVKKLLFWVFIIISNIKYLPTLILIVLSKLKRTFLRF
jgi:hypothetical protein